MVRHHLHRLLSLEQSYETLVPGMPNWQLLIVVNVAVFLMSPILLSLLSALLPAFSEEQVLGLLALKPDQFFSAPWTLVTSMFLHAGLMHLFFNMFALWMFGMVLEYKIGSRNFLILYFAAGLAGSLAYLFTSWGSTTAGLGASGAIYGILGAVAVLEPHLRVWMMGFVPMPMWMAAVFWAGLEFFGFFSGDTGIGYAAHLGGLFAGILLAYYLKQQAGSFVEGYDYQKY